MIRSVGIDFGLVGPNRVRCLDEQAQLCDNFSFHSTLEGLAALEERIFQDGSNPAIVFEPTGLAWLVMAIYLKARRPECRLVRAKTQKVATLRKYLRARSKSDRIDALTLAKMPFVDPEQLDEVYLPPAKFHALQRLTRQRERLEKGITARKNHLGAIIDGYLPGLRQAFDDRWSLRARAFYRHQISPFAVVDAVRPPRVQRPEMQTWDEDDIARFLKAAKDTPYYALFYTALFTGMRRSELLALRWQDVDFILSQVYVSRSLHVLKGGKVIFRSPKTSKGRRTIALPPSAVLLLEEHREKHKLERAMLGMPLTDDDLVFSHFDGKPLLPNTVTHAWIKLVRHAKLKPIRLHDARHTHASLMLKQGVHPKIVQERLGHSSIQITLDTYSHVAPGLQQAAAAVRFDEAFSTRYNKPENEAIERFR